MMGARDEMPAPMPEASWTRRHPIRVGIMVLFAFVALIAAIADYGSQRRRNHQLQLIRNSGEPLTIQDLIASEAPLRPLDNLAAILVAAAKPFAAIKIPNDRLKQIPVIGNPKFVPTGRRLPDEQLEGGKWYLDQEPGALAVMHDACKLSVGWCDYWKLTPILASVYPDLSEIGLAAKILALDVRMSAEQEDTDGAVRKLKNCYRCARFTDANRYRVIPGNLRRTGNAWQAMEATERVINRLQLADVELQTLQLEVEPWRWPEGLADSIVAERVSFMDYATSLRTGPWSNRGLMLIPMLRFADESAGVEKLTALIVALRTPEPGTWNAVLAWRKRTPAPSYYYMTSLLLKSFDRYIDLSFRSVGDARALVAAIACERFRLKHGRWPSALPEVCPEFLNQPPTDPFDGNPIRYGMVAEGVQLWTIGEDAVDNGGDIRRQQPRDYKNPPKDSGWIILNPDQRGKQ